MRNSFTKCLLWIWGNAERLLIVVFLATFTLNIRKVFLNSHSFLNGEFNEYMTLSLSWADILIATTFFIYAIKYIISQFFHQQVQENLSEYKYNILSIFNCTNVSRETILLTFFFGWAGLSIFWSQLQLLATYRFITFIQVILFTLITAKTLNSTEWLKLAKRVLVFNGIIQSVIGITQVIINKSLGLYFLGESTIGQNIDGVAKILIDGEKHIRAYGTLPHPNILAAFLLIPLLLVISELIFSDRKVPRETKSLQISPRFLFVIIIILLTGILCAGSRSALFGLIIGLGVLWIQYMVGREMEWNNTNCFSCLKHPFRLLSLLTISLIFFFYVAQHTSYFSNQSLVERKSYKIVSYETILQHPIKGVGLGQFIFDEYKLHPKMESWKYQPVHNVYLLVLSELGIVGFLLLSLLTIQFVFRVWEKLRFVKLTYNIYYVIIISFFPLLFFDHLFWDLKIGLFIFFLPFLFILASVKHNQNQPMSSEKFEKN